MTNSLLRMRLKFVAVVLVLAQPNAAQAAGEHGLAAERLKYEQSMSGLRAAVLKEIKEDKSDVKTRQDWRDAFCGEGVWPSISGAPRFSNIAADIQQARSRLEDAYERCLETVFDDVDLSRRIRAEWDQWSLINDAMEWRPLVASATGGESPKTINLSCNPAKSYRLEVKGRGKAPVHLWLHGDSAALVVEVESDGSFHAIVTYGPEGVVAADRGVLRSVAGPALSSSPSGFVVEAVDLADVTARWKPAPVDSERLGREAVNRLEAAAAARAAEDKAEQAAVEKQIVELMRKRRDIDGRRQRIEKSLAHAEKQVATLRAQIDRERSRGRDVSDLMSDLNRWISDTKSHRKNLTELNDQLSAIDAEIVRVRKA